MCRLLRQKHRMIVPYETVRMLLRQIDPVAVCNRRQHRLHRRTYFSHGPSDTWHIDGYDKLRPYGILISGYVTYCANGSVQLLGLLIIHNFFDS